VNYPLRYLIPAMLLVVGLLGAAAVGLTSLRMSAVQTEAAAMEFLTTIGHQAASDVAAGLRRENPARVRNAIEQLQVMRGLRRAFVVNGDDVVIHGSSAVLAGRRLAATEEPVTTGLIREARDERAQVRRIVGDSLYFASYIDDLRPGLFGADPAGHVLVVVYDFAQQVQAGYAAATNQALIVGVTVLGLSFACWFFLSTALVSRIASLVRSSKQIGEGNLRTPIRVPGHDEIADLARALDRMRIDLSDKQSRLELAAGDLEAAKSAVEQERGLLAERVEKRTRELTRANEELGRAKESAEAASRAKSAFLATVSHEIRTPMNGVLGAIELLERAGLDEDQATLLGTAQDSARSLLLLLNDLLDMAKIEAGRVEILRGPTSPRAIVERVVATFTPAAAARRSSLVADVAEDLPDWVQTDELRVQQVLANFVSNAAKFTEGGRIVVAARADAETGGRCRLRFTVSDTGIGIDPEVLPRLFEPFEQGTVEAARQSGGTGLGLAICRGLAERLGGRVALESTQGKGTVATFELPVDIGDEAPVADDAESEAEPAVPAEAPAGRARILVVDDHPVNLMLQLRQVEQLGASAAGAADGSTALTMLAEDRFDIVLTDCEMPRMDGFELARRIRSGGSRHRDVAIIACTAHALPDIGERCRAAGMDDVLTKPMRLADLAGTLYRHWPGVAPLVTELSADGGGDVLDEDALAMLTGGDAELRRTLMQRFLEDHWSALDDLRRSVEKGDPGACRKLAHRNKGASAIFGATALTEAFAALERVASDEPGNTAAQRDILGRIEVEGRRLAAALENAA